MAKMQPFWWFLAPPILEKIINGGFETGDFTGWTTSGNVSISSASPHSGTKHARFNAQNALITQTFSAPIPKSRMSSFGLYWKASGEWINPYLRVGVYYSVTKVWHYIEMEFPRPATYTYVDILATIPDGESIGAIDIAALAQFSSGDYFDLDDISMIDPIGTG